MKPLFLTFLAICLGVPSANAQPASKPLDPADIFRATVRGGAPYAYDDIAYRIRTQPTQYASIQKWMDRFGESLKGVSPTSLQVFTPGSAHSVSANNRRIYLHVLDHHRGGKASIHGLSDEGLEKVFWLGAPDKELKREFTGKALVISLTEKDTPAPDALDTVVVLQYAKVPKIVSPATSPQPDGSFVLHARDAIVQGSTLRYEPEPNKNTLGYWSDPADSATFLFYAPKFGVTYEIEVLQGCGKGSGGSEVEFQLERTILPMVVQDTGNFQNFVPRVIGRVKVGSGLTNINVVVKSKKGVAVMDLRQITLRPVKE